MPIFSPQNNWGEISRFVNNVFFFINEIVIGFMYIVLYEEFDREKVRQGDDVMDSKGDQNCLHEMMCTVRRM